MAGRTDHRAQAQPRAQEAALETGFRECSRLYDQRQWSSAARSSADFVRRWIDQPGLTVKSRDRLANAMWIACNSAGIDSWGDGYSGQTDRTALQGLNDLIAWLRAQPEALFRQREASMLCERMRWYRRRSEELDSLEELVGLLEDLDDLDVAKDMAARVVSRLPSLLYTPREDQLRYDAGVLDVLEEDDDLPEPDDIGVADQTVARMERIADALSELADCLVAEDDREASELEASILLAESEAVAKLGQQGRLESLYERLAALGDAALSACDKLIDRVPPADADAAPAASFIAASLMCKGGLLMLNDDENAALVVFTEVLDRFGERAEPVIVAMVDRAREMQQDIVDSEDDD